MIRTLKGLISGKNPPRVIVEVGGVGYGLFVPLAVFDELSLNQERFFYIHHHISEDKQELYGFLTAEQRDFFELLLTVSGVGPKSALSIVSSNTVDILRSAISEGDSQIFSNASGVGRKIAERIIVDLKSKIGEQPGLSMAYGDTYEALRGLGYTAAEVKRALNEIPADVSDTQEQIKLALKALARK